VLAEVQRRLGVEEKVEFHVKICKPDDSHEGTFADYAPELKPCPFCGSEARWAASSEAEDWEILCTNQECPVIFIGGDHTGVELERAWNTRPQHPQGNAHLISASIEMYEAGTKLNALVIKAQQFLARYIVPDSGISDTEAVKELLGIFDGTEQREAQLEWSAALAKVDVRGEEGTR
jgi:hypothetical protein